MEIKEFIEKYFVPALVENRETGNIELNINQSVWDNPVRVPDADEDIFVHCRKGHVLKAKINDIADIVDKGCPFCKRHVNERYIKYMKQHTKTKIFFLWGSIEMLSVFIFLKMEKIGV